MKMDEITMDEDKKPKTKFDTFMEMYEINIYRVMLYMIVGGVIAVAIWVIINMYGGELV